MTAESPSSSATLELLRQLAEDVDAAQQQYNAAKHQRDLCALNLLAQGHTKVAVAEAMGVTRVQLYRIIDTKAARS